MSFERVDERTAGPPSEPERSRLTWYREPETGKRFFVLRQKGAFADLCHDHGTLLAREIEEGVFPEIVAMIDSDLDAARDWLDWVFSALYARFSDDVLSACSGEFRTAVRRLGEGYFAGHPDPAFDMRDVENACTAIDVGNLATGFVRRLSKPLAAENVPTFEYLLGALRRYRRQATGRNLSVDLALRKREAAGALEAEGRRRRIGMGCTGFSAAGGLCEDGRALHARTFDGAFFRWNARPGLFLIDERGASPGAKHRYAAVGTAGLIYPGGISGVNDAGIACSLHQMSTVRYADGRAGGAWEIAPFVQQRILREAGSLDEAVAIAQGINHFASWTILVSDARAGRTLRIEINGAEDARGRYDGQVRASAAEDRMVQTNHFVDETMRERFDFFEDRHFTKSVGKWLETRARHRTVTERMDLVIGTESFGTDEAIELLAGHQDATVGGARRSFGRTVCKAYGLMASLVRASPDRDAPDDELWFTIGDRLPGPHALFAGFRIDWEGFALTPVAERPGRRATQAPGSFRDALGAYVRAFETLERPRDADGALLRRAPSAAETDELRARALSALDQAIRLVENEGTIDPAFRYARARIAHAAEDFARAERDWRLLLDLGTSPAPAAPLSLYETALVHLFAAATISARGDEAEAHRLLDRGLEALGRLEEERFASGRPHPGFAQLRKLAAEIRADGAAAPLPSLDFVTVE